MTTVKVIGGTADGRVYTFEGNPPHTLNVPVAAWAGRWWEHVPTEDQPTPLFMEQERYRLHKIYGATRLFCVFIPETWTADDLFERLIFDA